MNRRRSPISPASSPPFSPNAAGRFAYGAVSIVEALGANRYFGYFFFFYAFTAAGGTSM